MTEHLLILSLVFFAVSTLFSMLGMGGGILYVPILLFAGVPITRAPALSLLLIAATSSAALFIFQRKRKVDWKLALVIDPPTDLMAFVGGYLSALVPAPVLRAILAAVLALSGLLMLRGRALRPAESAACARDRRWYWHRRFGGTEYAVNLPLVLTATGLIGLLSGMLGITGGIIKLPIMVLLCGVPMDIAVGTSTVMVAVTALFGLAGHALHGNVPWQSGAILAAAAVAGGLLGGRISLSVDKTRLKRLFGFVVLLIAARLLFRL